MKILLDACVPRPLRKFLPDHAVNTAQELTWGQLKNGDLLRAAETEFEALIPSDQKMKYQQKVVGRKLAILVLPTNDWPTIHSRAAEIAAKVTTLRPGDFVELRWLNG